MDGQDRQRGGYTSLSDMFDGGGPGASGGPFQGGGMISAVGNVLTGNRGTGVGPEAGAGFAGYGYQSPQGWVGAFQDMRDGGGAGRAGNTFMGGGHYSGLLNMLGVRPMGYEDRQSAMGAMPPQPRPSMPAAPQPAQPARPAPTSSGMTPVSSYVPAPPSAISADYPNRSAAAASDPFIGLDRLLNAPRVPAVPGVNAPLVSGDPNLTALRTYLGGM